MQHVNYKFDFSPSKHKTFTKCIFPCQVVCGKCSTKKAPLQYDDGKLNRVCDDCYSKLETSVGEISKPEAQPTPSKRRKGVLQVGYIPVQMWWDIFLQNFKEMKGVLWVSHLINDVMFPFKTNKIRNMYFKWDIPLQKKGKVYFKYFTITVTYL